MKKKIASVLIALAMVLNPITAEAKNVYGLGDSIMAGSGNLNYGTCDVLGSRYGYKVSNDTSIGGAHMTPSSMLPTTAISTVQLNNTLDAIKRNGYDEDTKIIIDGGGNDCKNLMNAHYRGLPVDITIDRISYCTGMSLYQLAHAVGNDNPSQGYQVKIYFLIPNISAPYFKKEEYRNATTFTYVAKQTEVVQSMSDLGIVCVNLNDILTYSDMADAAHPNMNGYIKISDYIERN